LEPKRRSTVFDWAVRPAPTGDGREAAAGRLADDRPVGEHDRLSDRAPVDLAGRDRATWAADVLAYRKVKVVAGQACSKIAGRVPKLGEARIEIHVDGATERPAQNREPQVAGDIDQ